MAFDPNPLFYAMSQIYADEYCNIEKSERSCIRIRNEGGSRSSKTFDFFHLLIAICSNNQDQGIETYVYRDTLTNCRDFTLKDFIKCLRICGIYDQNFLHGYGQKPEYTLYGNPVYFRGLEDDIEYPPSHICFFNEMMEMSEIAYNNASQRCTMLDVGDWNPKFTDHWVFKQEGKPNTWFTHTNYLNNKHIDPSLVKRYESWSPWMIEDMQLPIDLRRPHLENIKNGTVDLFRWLVYGCGIRCAMEGVIFGGQDIPVTYVNEKPKEYDSRYFGLDFGNTTGTWAFSDSVRIAEGANRGIYYDCPIYSPFSNADEFYKVFKAYYDSVEHGNHWMVVSDCARPQYINDLNALAANDEIEVTFIACKKFDGCVEWRIGLMKKNLVYLVNRPYIKKEQENYFWGSVNGIKINKAKKDGHDHFFDAAGMSIQYDDSIR